MAILFALVIAFYATRFLYLWYSLEWFHLAIFSVVCFSVLLYLFAGISGTTTKLRKLVFSSKGVLVLAGGASLVVAYHFLSEYSNWLMGAGAVLLGSAWLLGVIAKRRSEPEQLRSTSGVPATRAASEMTTTSRDSGLLTNWVDNLLQRSSSQDRARTFDAKRQELEAQNKWAGEVEENYGWQRKLWGKRRADPNITGRTKTAEDVKDVAEQVKLAEKRKELRDLKKPPPAPPKSAEPLTREQNRAARQAKLDDLTRRKNADLAKDMSPAERRRKENSYLARERELEKELLKYL